MIMEINNSSYEDIEDDGCAGSYDKWNLIIG